MNANQIHNGHEYAVVRYPPKPRGNVFISSVRRVVAYGTFGKQEWGNTRDTMYLRGFELDLNTGEPLSTQMREFRVRDVVDDWEEWEDRRDQHEIEQEKINREREERYRREQEEWERRRKEQEERIRQQRQDAEEKARQQRVRAEKLRQKLYERSGIDPIKIQVDYNTGKVEIPLVDLENWLNNLTKVECMTCHRELIMIPSGIFNG